MKTLELKFIYGVAGCTIFLTFSAYLLQAPLGRKLFPEFSYWIGSISLFLLPTIMILILSLFCLMVFKLSKSNNNNEILQFFVPVIVGFISLLVTLNTLSEPVKSYNNKKLAIQEENKYFEDELEQLIEKLKNNDSDKNEYLKLIENLNSFYKDTVLNYDATKYTIVGNREYFEYKNNSKKINNELKILSRDLEDKNYKLEKNQAYKYHDEFYKLHVNYISNSKFLYINRPAIADEKRLHNSTEQTSN